MVNKIHLRSYKYKSTHHGQSGIDECNAKSFLSSYAYKELFVKAMKGADWLQKETENNGNISIWPANQDKNISNVVVLKPNMRCPCKKRVGFMFQCKHEYLVDSKFNIDKYDN